MKRKFLERILKLTLISTLLFTLTNCYLFPCPYYSGLNEFDETPKNQSVIGNYKLDINPPASSGPGELILMNDSTLIFKNIPISILDNFNSDYNNKKESLQDIKGTWEISKYNGQLSLAVNLKFKKTEGEIRNYKSHWSLYKKNNKPVILIILGDPDSCEALKFIKKD